MPLTRQSHNSPRLSLGTVGSVLLVLVFGLMFGLGTERAAEATVPAVVASAQSVYASVPGAVPFKVVADSAGDIFTADIGNSEVWEAPAGGGTPIVIETGLGGIAGLAVDSARNLYAISTYSGNVFFIPYSGESYNTGSQVNLLENFGSLDGYYMQAADVTVDNTTGIVYISMGACCSSSHTIFSVNEDASNPKIVVSALPGANAAAQMAADGHGHLYYADDVNVYVVDLTAPTPTPTIFGASLGLSSPGGVAFDAAGNLLISDTGNQRIVEVPLESGALNLADAQTLVSNIAAGYAVARDNAGSLYYGVGYSGPNSINKITLGSAGFAATAPGSSASQTVAFSFNASVSPAAVVLQQGNGTATDFNLGTGGTCAAGSYTAGQFCTVMVNFAPITTGVRRGAIVLTDASGNALGTGYLSGVGTGAAGTVDPGTQTALTPTTAFGAVGNVALGSDGFAYVVDPTAGVVDVFNASGAFQSAIGVGLSSPQGVAVDGAGNVYIADTGNNRVVEVPLVNGSLATADQTTIATGLSGPTSVSVGAGGSIYVADTGNARVLRLQTYAGSGDVIQTTVGTGFTSPSGVATDAADNVYVADKGANTIVLVNLQGGAQTTLLSGAPLASPAQIALDAANDLYVVNGGVVDLIPNVSGALNPSLYRAIGTGITAAAGVAVDGGGHAVIADAAGPAAYLIDRTTGTLNFGTVNEGNSSATEALVLGSAGTAALSVGTPVYTVTGATTDYAVAASDTGGCTASSSLAVGTTCSVSATFSPLTTGTLTADVAFNTNAANAAVSGVLTGVGTNLVPTTTVLALTSGSSPSYGQAVSVSATVASTQPGNTPTGTVTFFVDGTAQTPVALSATAPYTASATFNGLAAGTHVINASYSGDSQNASSSATTPLTVTIAKATPTVSVSLSPSYAVTPGTTINVTVTVAGSTGTPTGTVTLQTTSGETTTVLGTGTLSNGSVTIPITLSTVGQYSVVAVYSGDTNFAGISSPGSNVSIRNPGFDVSVSNSSLSVAAGSSVSTTFTITTVAGFGSQDGATIGVGGPGTPPAAPCAGLPAYVTCTFQPGFVSFPASATPATATVTLTVSTDVPPPVTVGRIPTWPAVLGGVLLLLAFLRRRGRYVRLLVLLVAAGLGFTALNGCGNGGSAAKTPTGSSSVVVTFTGTQSSGSTTPLGPNLSSSVTLTLNVH